MLDYTLITVAGVAVFAQALLGLLVTTRPPSEQRRIWYEISFGVLGAVGLVAVIWGGIRTAETQTRIDTNMQAIQSGQQALPNKVIGVMARLMGVPSKNGQYPETVIGSISSKIEDLQRRQVAAPIIIPGGTTYEVPVISALLDVQKNGARLTKLVLPRHPYVGERFDVKFSGRPSDTRTADQILVDGNGSTVDGYPEYSMPFTNQSITITFDGKRWVVT